MRTLGTQVALHLLLLALWVVSFFLPALSLDKPVVGYITALLSANVGYTFIRSHQVRDLYLGSFWLANLFMLASPFGLWRARIRKGKVFLTFFAIFNVLTLSFGVYSRIHHDVGTVLIGWWLWEASLVGLTMLMFAIRRAHSADV